MFTNKKEEDFFMSHLNDSHRVLEYGSGISTIEISKKVKEIISIEHQETWYSEIFSKLPSNCTLILKKPNLEYTEGGHCGTYEQFKDYVEAPMNFGIFDIVLIDGRARVSCASIVNKFSNKNTIIFVHDFNREEYQDIKNYLEIVDSADTMYKFKIKFYS